MKKNVLMLVVAVSYLFALSGCNTIAGAGQDIQKGGEKIEDAAKKKS